MDKYTPKIVRHLPAMVFLTLIVMMGVEYFGWKIIEYSFGADHFPGFFSFEVLASVIINSTGAFIFGALFAACSFLIPSFRMKWKSLIHIPVWFGIILFSAYMIILVMIGLNTV
jgi:hypothetical protein